MNLETAVALAGVLAACGSVLLTVFVLRPMVARARLGQRVLQQRNIVMDAVLRGEIDPDDPAVHNLLDYTQALASRPKSFGVTEALALHRSMIELGIHSTDQLFDRATYGHMTPAGRRTMNEADRALQIAVADYLVGGSKFWFVLAPLRAIARLTKHTAGRHTVTPGELAADYRSASRRMDVTHLGRRTVAV